MSEALDLDQLRRDAENPLIAPSRRVAARQALRVMKEADADSDQDAAAAIRWAIARGIIGERPPITQLCPLPDTGRVRTGKSIYRVALTFSGFAETLITP